MVESLDYEIQFKIFNKLGIKRTFTSSKVSDYERLSKLIEKRGGTISNTDFTDKVRIEFMLKTTELNEFEHKLSEAFFGKIKAKAQKEISFPIKI